MTIRSAKHTLVLALFACIATAGCKSTTETTSSTDIEGVPEVAAVELRLTGAAASEGTATESDAVDVERLAADELEHANIPETTDATDLGQLRGAVKRLNDSIRDFLGPVAAMVRGEKPSYQLGKLKMWGPVTRGATEYRFFLRHAEAHRWGWRLDARVADSAETYSRVAAGEIVVGTQARRGVGLMGFDLDELAAVDPTVTAQGQVLVGFKHGALGTSAAYALRDFSRDTAAQAGVDAVLRAVHLETGFNRVRLAYRGNVDGTATAAEELVLARVRHRSDIGGRSDLIALSGDVPAGEAFVVSQCWNVALQSGFREVRSCPLDGLLGAGCVVTKTEGDPLACHDLWRNAELPPADPAATMADAEDPNSDVAAPTEIPTVEGDAG